MRIKEKIEHLRELLNRAIEMDANPDEILRMSQQLDKLIVEFMSDE